MMKIIFGFINQFWIYSLILHILFPGNMTLHPLRNDWTLYFHNNAENWGLETYIKLFTIQSIEDFWRVYNNIHQWDKGMFFLMKGDTPPIWEMGVNKKGSSWSFRIPRDKSNDIWRETSMACIGGFGTDNLSKEQNLVGISISPKNKTCTLRFWFSVEDVQLQDLRKDILYVMPEFGFYRKNNEPKKNNPIPHKIHKKHTIKHR